jgi:arginyl-tRNA synthetase
MEKTIDLLKEKKLLKEDRGAEIVDLSEYGLGACLIKKSDGATLYATRDLTAAIERFQNYHFHKMIYEVGSEQKLHFRQVFKVLNLLGFNWAENCIHVEHGLYLDSDGKKFATRKGKTVFMEDVLKETLSLAKQEIEKREKLQKNEIEKRAKAIALSAIFYGDLKNYRSNSIIFDIDKFLSFEGDTGPYLLYTYARARSILRKAKYKKTKYPINELTDSEKQLIAQFSKFPEMVNHAYENLSPNIIANYSFQLSQLFNEFYHKTQVLGSENEKFRLALVDSFSQVLKNSLFLLGISTLERM